MTLRMRRLRRVPGPGGGGGGGEPPPGGTPRALIQIGMNFSGYQYYVSTSMWVDMLIQSYPDWPISTGYTGPGGVEGSPYQAVGGSAHLTPDAEGNPTTDFRVSPHWLEPQPGAAVAKGQFTGWADSITSTGTSRVTSVNNKVYDPGTNTTTFDVNIAATLEGTMGSLNFIGTRRTGGAGGAINTGVKDLVLAHPGYTVEDIALKRITDEAKTYIQLFDSMRMMDVMDTNNLPDTWTWANAPLRASRKCGRTYDDIADLANKTQRDPHIQMPHAFVSDADMDAFLDFWEAAIDPARVIHCGVGNESWNPSFSIFFHYMNRTLTEVKGFLGDSRVTRNITSASRTANVVTMAFPVAHEWTNGQTLYFFNFDGAGGTTVINNITVVNPTTVTFSKTGADGAIAVNNVRICGTLDTELRFSTSLSVDNVVDVYELSTRNKIRHVMRLSERARLRPTIGDAKVGTRWRFHWEDQMSNNDGRRPLDYIKAKFPARSVGKDPTTGLWGYFWALSGAPYFFVDPYQNQTGATLDQLATAFNDNCRDARSDYVFEKRKCVALEFGLESVCYEGGPDTKYYNGDSTLQDRQVRSALQFDSRIEAPITTMLGTDWFARGGGLFEWYTGGFLKPDGDTVDGVWGVTDKLTNLTTPKLNAFASLKASPPALTRNLVPFGPIDARVTADVYVLTGAFPNFGSFLPFGDSGFKYLCYSPAAGNYNVKFGYKYNFAQAHGLTLRVNGVQQGATYTPPLNDTVNVYDTANLPVVLPQGWFVLEVRRTESQGNDLEFRTLSILAPA